VGLVGGGLRSRSDCLQFSCWYRNFVGVRGEQGDGSQDTLMPWLVFWVDGKRLPGGGRGGLAGSGQGNREYVDSSGFSVTHWWILCHVGMIDLKAGEERE